jgi:hypothetical protein
MIKLSELIDKQFQPSEKPRMKDYLKRASRDQENVYKEPSIYEEPLEPNGRPENRNANTRFNPGFPWDFEDPSGIFEIEELNKIHQALIGREFQTLQDVKKMCSRLRQSGFAQSDIDEFLRTYIL